jgi:hypothetical protein
MLRHEAERALSTSFMLTVIIVHSTVVNRLSVTFALHTLALAKVLWQSYISIVFVHFLPIKRGYCGCRRHPVIPQSPTLLEFN